MAKQEGTVNLILGVIGYDCHSVGNKILDAFFTEEGFKVTNLGVMVSQGRVHRRRYRDRGGRHPGFLPLRPRPHRLPGLPGQVHRARPRRRHPLRRRKSRRGQDRLPRSGGEIPRPRLRPGLSAGRGPQGGSPAPQGRHREEGRRAMKSGRVLSVDIGSTYTKGALFEFEGPGLKVLKRASRPTTQDDLARGFGLVAAELLGVPWKGSLGDLDRGVPIRFSSSAKGGLRVGAIGLVPDLTLQVARLAAWSAGARIVGTSSYRLTEEILAGLLRSDPDIILLSGGTDGGNEKYVLANAALLAASSFAGTVIYAGNRATAGDAARLLSGKTFVLAENVLPEIGTLKIEPAREAIRKIFLDTIIRGKGLEVVRLFCGADPKPTPLGVFDLVKAIGERAPDWKDFCVIDLGGATTDFYSAGEAYRAEDGVVLRGLKEPYLKRTVEGDLGLRVSAEALFLTARAWLEEAAGPREFPRPGSLGGTAEGEPGDASGERDRGTVRRPPRGSLFLFLRLQARGFFSRKAGLPRERFSSSPARTSGPTAGSSAPAATFPGPLGRSRSSMPLLRHRCLPTPKAASRSFPGSFAISGILPIYSPCLEISPRTGPRPRSQPPSKGSMKRKQGWKGHEKPNDSANDQGRVPGSAGGGPFLLAHGKGRRLPRGRLRLPAHDPGGEAVRPGHAGGEGEETAPPPAPGRRRAHRRAREAPPVPSKPRARRTSFPRRSTPIPVRTGIRRRPSASRNP